MDTRTRCYRILCVEDHEDTLVVTCKLLRAAGHTVVGVSSCAAARAAAADEQQRFDLLIVDVSLPDGDGLPLLAEMRHHYAVDGIVLSGFGTDGDRTHSHAAGFAAHLVKPIQFQTLADAIAQLVDRRQQRRDAAGAREGAA